MTPIARTAALVVLATVAVPGGAHAQRVADLPAGARIWAVARGGPRSGPLWLLSPGGRGARGSVARVTADTLYVARGVRQRDSVWAIPRAGLEAVYVSTGRSSRVTRVLGGGGVGAAVFAGGGALTSALADGGLRRERVLTSAGVGALVGILLGATQPLDRWRRVGL